MDRFIAWQISHDTSRIGVLKSNMDRFIVKNTDYRKGGMTYFKIQYGQIYRAQIVPKTLTKSVFKIQYGQIYSH